MKEEVRVLWGLYGGARAPLWLGDQEGFPEKWNELGREEVHSKLVKTLQLGRWRRKHAGLEWKGCQGRESAQR